MADVHNIKTRSYNMSKIKGRDTKPEMLVRKFLHSKGLRFLLHNKKLPGRPDLTLPKYKVAIFVNGCFWHGHKDCKYFKIPNTKSEWWSEKISKTIKRDDNALIELCRLGWNSIVIWECELKLKIINTTLTRTYHIILNNKIK